MSVCSVWEEEIASTKRRKIYIVSPRRLAQAVTVLICILEVLGSNLVRNSCYPDKFFVICYSPSGIVPWITPQLLPSVYISFIIHYRLTIQRRTVWITDSVVVWSTKETTDHALRFLSSVIYRHVVH
jgi:hypothetical protein